MRTSCRRARWRGILVIRPTIPGINKSGVTRVTGEDLRGFHHTYNPGITATGPLFLLRCFYKEALAWSLNILKLATIPCPSEFPGSDEEGLGQALNQSVMQSHSECKCPEAGQRDIVSRQIDPRETISFLKVAEAASLQFPVGKV